MSDHTVAMIDLDLLRYFVVVAEEGSIARAAELLHIAASPLSRKVRMLERSLGVALFDRRGQRLSLTPAGADFLIEARRLVVHANRVGSSAARLGPGGRAVRLAVGVVDGIADIGWFNQSMAKFIGSNLEAQVEVDTSMRSHELFAALADGIVDIAVTYRAPDVGSRLIADLLDEEPLMVALPATHPLAVDTDEPMIARLLNGESLILPSPARSLAGYADIDAALRRCGAVASVRFTASDPRTMLGLVGAGLGIGFVRAGTEVRNGHVVLRQPPVGFAITVPTYVTTAPGDRPISAAYRSSVIDAVRGRNG